MTLYHATKMYTGNVSALMLLVGWQEGHPAWKKIEWWGTGMVICLERDADLHMAQLMPLPLTVSCFSKIQIGFTFLVLVHTGSPGKRATKCVCVCNVSVNPTAADCKKMCICLISTLSLKKTGLTNIKHRNKTDTSSVLRNSTPSSFGLDAGQRLPWSACRVATAWSAVSYWNVAISQQYANETHTTDNIMSRRSVKTYNWRILSVQSFTLLPTCPCWQQPAHSD